VGGGLPTWRGAPPTAARPQIHRDRLLGQLRGRFERRLTLVVAGPGFGKTSLLAQAAAEDRLAPLGSDVWLSAVPADAYVSGLAGAGGDPGPADAGRTWPALCCHRDRRRRCRPAGRSGRGKGKRRRKAVYGRTEREVRCKLAGIRRSAQRGVECSRTAARSSSG